MRSIGAPVVSIISPKGGVGKTTVAANLAAAIAQQGRRPLLVDLDPQNATRLYHQMPLEDSRGLAVQSLLDEPWADAVYEGPYGADCLPYGTITEADRSGVEALIDDQPDWLESGLASLELDSDRVVLIDSPPGGTVYLSPALRAADLVLFVLLPDAASFVTLPTMDRWLAEFSAPPGHSREAFYLLNRMNNARSLCRDVHAAMKEQLGDRLCPQLVHFDSAVEEALASQQPVTEYAPDGVAAKDFQSLGAWVVDQI